MREKQRGPWFDTRMSPARVDGLAPTAHPPATTHPLDLALYLSLFLSFSSSQSQELEPEALPDARTLKP